MKERFLLGERSVDGLSERRWVGRKVLCKKRGGTETCSNQNGMNGKRQENKGI